MQISTTGNQLQIYNQICKWCQRSFKNLDVHLNLNTWCKNSRKFSKCKYCNKEFESFRGLNLHMKSCKSLTSIQPQKIITEVNLGIIRINSKSANSKIEIKNPFSMVKNPNISSKGHENLNVIAPTNKIDLLPKNSKNITFGITFQKSVAMNLIKPNLTSDQSKIQKTQQTGGIPDDATSVTFQKMANKIDINSRCNIRNEELPDMPSGENKCGQIFTYEKVVIKDVHQTNDQTFRTSCKRKISEFESSKTDLEITSKIRLKEKIDTNTSTIAQIQPNYHKPCHGNLEMVQTSEKIETEKDERFIQEKEKTKSILASVMAKLRANKIKSSQSTEQEVTEHSNEALLNISEFSFEFENNTARTNQEMKPQIKEELKASQYSVEFEDFAAKNQEIKPEIKEEEDKGQIFKSAVVSFSSSSSDDEDEKPKKDEPIVNPFASEKINSEKLKKLLVEKLEMIMDREKKDD